MQDTLWDLKIEGHSRLDTFYLSYYFNICNSCTKRETSSYITTAWHTYVQEPLPLFISYASPQLHNSNSLLYRMNIGHGSIHSRGNEWIWVLLGHLGRHIEHRLSTITFQLTVTNGIHEILSFSGPDDNLTTYHSFAHNKVVSEYTPLWYIKCKRVTNINDIYSCNNRIIAVIPNIVDFNQLYIFIKL